MGRQGPALGNGGFKKQGLPAGRVLHEEAPGQECDLFAGKGVPGSVPEVSQNRAPQVRELDPDLVASSGFRTHFHQADGTG